MLLKGTVIETLLRFCIYQILNIMPSILLSGLPLTIIYYAEAIYFGESTQQWVTTFYAESQSSASNNSFIMEFSPYLAELRKAVHCCSI